MFTLDINKKVINYLILALGCFIFTNIYNRFGHGVYSLYMNYLFIWPLIGAILYFGLSFINKGNNKLGSYIMNTGILALIYGSLLRGIFEIAGTASTYTGLFFITGSILFIIGLIILIISKPDKKAN